MLGLAADRMESLAGTVPPFHPIPAHRCAVAAPVQHRSPTVTVSSSSSQQGYRFPLSRDPKKCEICSWHTPNHKANLEGAFFLTHFCFGPPDDGHGSAFMAGDRTTLETSFPGDITPPALGRRSSALASACPPRPSSCEGTAPTPLRRLRDQPRQLLVRQSGQSDPRPHNVASPHAPSGSAVQQP